MNRATTSFPVPDSPTSNTVVSVRATCVAALRTACHASEGPTMRPAFAASSSDNERTRASSRSARKFGFGRLTGQVGELVVRDGEGHVIRDAAGHPQLPLLERVSPLRPEYEGQHLIASGQVDRQRRAVSRRANPIPKIRGLDRRAGIRFFVDGIPRRSPGDRRLLERFSKTCLYQWRPRSPYVCPSDVVTHASVEAPVEDDINKPRREATLTASVQPVTPSLVNSAARNRSMSAGARPSIAPIWLVGAPCAISWRASRSEGVIRKTGPLSTRRPASGTDSDGGNFRM